MRSIICMLSVLSLSISSPVYIERDLSHWQHEYQQQLELLAWTHQQQQLYASGGYGQPSTAAPTVPTTTETDDNEMDDNDKDDMDDMTTEEDDNNEMTTESDIDEEGSAETMDDMSPSDAMMMNEEEDLEMNK